MQTFTAPLNTNYKIECWGASGGNSYGHLSYSNTVYGGKGGYCSGVIVLSYNNKFYVYVGQSGEETIERTFNGGGAAANEGGPLSGGGATDIRLVDENGAWNNFNSLKSRIMVAAGGGGGSHYYTGCNGGYAGGLSGQNGFYSVSPFYTGATYSVATGATQISGGKGGKGVEEVSGFDGTFGSGGDFFKFGSGGGGGYYGGGGADRNQDIIGSGAGGSSFISGYPGCNAIAESSTEDNIIHTGKQNHYSGKVFTNSVMIDGGSVMPKPRGGTETGHEGNGYCIITWQQLPQ